MQKTNTDIEVLRALAILITVFGHMRRFWSDSAYLDFRNQFAFWGGVDLFFCISGFVITKSLIELSKNNDHSKKLNVAIAFWIRRAWRLWPSAWLWLCISFVATVWFNNSGIFGETQLVGKDALAAVLQVANFNWLGCLHFGSWKCSAFDVYWSLSLEEQFYLIFPWLLLGLPKRWFIPTISIFILSQLFIDRSAWTPWWAVRSDAILLEVLVAKYSERIAYIKFDPKIFSNHAISFISLFIVMSLFIVIPSKYVELQFSTGILALLSFALVWIASYDKNYIWRAGVTKNILCWIGSRSYGLYLIHIPALSFTYELTFQATNSRVIQSYWFPLLSIPFLAILAELNFRFIERPLRGYGRKKADTVLAYNAENKSEKISVVVKR